MQDAQYHDQILYISAGNFNDNDSYWGGLGKFWDTKLKKNTFATVVYRQPGGSTSVDVVSKTPVPAVSKLRYLATRLAPVAAINTSHGPSDCLTFRNHSFYPQFHVAELHDLSDEVVLVPTGRPGGTGPG